MFPLFVALIAIAIPFSDPAVRRNRQLKNAVILVMIAHQLASVLQVALNGLPTMKMDPLSFNGFAMTGEGHLSQNSYAQLLHFLYQLFGPSHLLGCEISNVFFSLALLVQLSLLGHLGYEKSLPKLILVFGLLPSCILNTSVTLREAAQMFCYLSITLLLLKVCRQGLTSSTLLLLPLTLAITYLHQGMAALVLVLIPLSIAWALQARPGILVALCIVAASGGVLVKDRIMNSLTARSAMLQNVSEGNLDYIQDYATKVEDSRTSFGTSLDLSSPVRAVKTGSVLLTYYLFSPLPWQVRGTLDLYGFFESLLRILLCVSAIRTIRNTRGTPRREHLLLALLFLAMEIGWATGTANWGTAFRHRLVAWGVLVAAGGGIFLERPTGSPEDATKSKAVLSVRGRRRALQRKTPRVSPSSQQQMTDPTRP